jgi:hypothetical protein
MFLNVATFSVTNRSLSSIAFAISIETPPVDCQFGNAAKMFSNFFFILLPILIFILNFIYLLADPANFVPPQNQ